MSTGSANITLISRRCLVQFTRKHFYEGGLLGRSSGDLFEFRWTVRRYQPDCHPIQEAEREVKQAHLPKLTQAASSSVRDLPRGTDQTLTTKSLEGRTRPRPEPQPQSSAVQHLQINLECTYDCQPKIRVVNQGSEYFLKAQQKEIAYLWRL